MVKIQNTLNELCWFGASLLAVGAFGLVVLWIDERAAYPAWPARDALLWLGGGALAVMVVLTVLAFTLESRGKR